MKPSESDLIWEAYNPSPSQGGYFTNELPAPKVTGVKVHDEFTNLSDEELQNKLEAIQEEIERRSIQRKSKLGEQGL